MVQETQESLKPGEKLEFWARKTAVIRTPYLRLTADGEVPYQVIDLPDYFEYFSYVNRTGKTLAIELATEGWELSFAYKWHPDSVARVGIEFLSGAAEADESGAGSMAVPARPRLHFSPEKQWMNDPNGLCYLDGRYHLFYQFYPNRPHWGPMHWGHAVSPDLFNWVHYPVFLHPEQNLLPLGATGGAFSGTACRDPSGQPLFFYTERLPAYDLHRGYVEIQKRVRPDAALTEPASVRTVLSERPAGVGCDFRDPKVWFDRDAGLYWMILGASIDGDPAVLLYASPDSIDWTYRGPLYVAPPFFRENGARCAECPDFFELDGRWVLYMGFVGFQDPATQRHNLMYYLVGDFSADTGFRFDGELREIDFGTDFYAMQSFESEGSRLALAWLYNWEFQKPPGSNYSGEMSLPRQLSLGPSGQLCMHPIVSGLKSESLPFSPSSPLTYYPGDNAFVLRLSATGRDLDELAVTGTDATGHRFSVRYRGNRISLEMPEDDGSIQYVSEVPSLGDLTLYFDRGIVELFINGGCVCGTRRSYRIDRVESLVIDVDHTNHAVEVSAETLARSGADL